jgi:branched-chain amino acid transport system substrate-binding protein
MPRGVIMEDQQGPSGAVPMPAQKSKALWVAVAVIVVAVVVLLAAVLLGLLGGPGGPVEDDVLRIGTVLSLTGSSGLEAFGPSNLRGAQLAVEEINAAGGVNGRNIVLVSEDDGGSTTTARDRAQKLVTTDNVDVILGAVGSGFCASVLEVAKANERVQISASCTSPIFSNQSFDRGWFFRTAPSDALQGVVAATYAAVNRSFTNMVVFGNNNPYGIGLANVFAEKFRELVPGGTARVRILAEGLTSYASDLEATLTTPLPDAIYMAEYPVDGLIVLQNWWANTAWRNIEWIFSEGVLDQSDFVDKLPPIGIDSATIQTFEGSAPGAYLGIVGAIYDQFETRYAAEYPNDPATPQNESDPGLFTANAYDAVYLAAAAAQEAGSDEPIDIRTHLRTVSAHGDVFVGGQWAQIRTAIAAGRDINYEGASGSANFDRFGEPLSGYAIWGIDAANEVVTLEFFDEDTVVGLVQGAPPAPVSAAESRPYTVVARSRD